MAVGDFRFSLLLLSLIAAVAATPSDDRRKAADAGNSHDVEEAGANGAKKEEPSRGMFAPRMYYDEWTPLGHGDPLKNDPTYDYVPPVLGHVHYWKEANQRSSSTDPPIARRDSDSKQVQAPLPTNLFQTMPDIPATMLIPPPPPPRTEIISAQPTRSTSTTEVDVEPVNMILHSSTTISWLDFKNPVATMSSGVSVAPWKASNTPIIEPSPLPTMTHTSVSPFQRYRDEIVKERPFSPNSIFHKSPDPPGHKPHFPVKNNPTNMKATIPIQAGQPFRLPQANPAPILPKPTNSDETESYASILQSLLDDTPTTTTTTARQEASVGVLSTMPPPVATTMVTSMTTDHIFSHSAPLYLIIQGHSKVKTYGASKSPVLEIPHNEVSKDNKSKNRYSRETGTSSQHSLSAREIILAKNVW